MKYINKLMSALFISACFIVLPSCTPEVGSEAWCTNMKEKPKGDWTTNEATAYTKDCIF